MILLIKLLLLLVIANGTPVIASKCLGACCDWPLDGSLKFLDGRPLLGTSKTVRGVVLAVAMTTVAALLLDLSWHTGMMIGVFAMVGDLLSSFIKRRLDRAPSSMFLGLDQIPESLLPLLMVKPQLGLATSDIAILVFVFLVLELAGSRLLYKWHIRKRPY